MAMLSSVHHLCRAAPWQAYLHTLRWKDRPLQWPRCYSHDVEPWGQSHDRPGCQRYRCQGCKRPCNDLTATLLHQSTRPLAYWILATFLLGRACASRRMAREVGSHVRTSDRWGWWRRHAALSSERQRQ